MTKHEHADKSAKIFGGKSELYLPIHELIGLGKTKTLSVFRGLSIHHYDVGRLILEKIFGKIVPGTEDVAVADVLAQSLIEDYGKILTFEEHWSKLMEGNMHFPKLCSDEEFAKRVLKDSILQSLKTEEVDELDDFFRLKTITANKKVHDSPYVFCVLGHTLGIDIAVKILGKKFHGVQTKDVITRYLSCRFVWNKEVHRRVLTPDDYRLDVSDSVLMCVLNQKGVNSDTRSVEDMVENFCCPSNVHRMIIMLNNLSPEDKEKLGDLKGVADSIFTESLRKAEENMPVFHSDVSGRWNPGRWYGK